MPICMQLGVYWGLLGLIGVFGVEGSPSQGAPINLVTVVANRGGDLGPELCSKTRTALAAAAIFFSCRDLFHLQYSVTKP